MIVMQSRKSLIVMLILAAFSCALCAQETGGETEKTVESPSPDGRFAFLSTNKPEEQRTFDLIKKKGKKVLLRVAQSDEDSNELATEVLWSPDSKRFVLTVTYHNKRLNDLSLYSRAGNTFREVKLSDLPEATLPEKLGSDKDHFWHINVIDWKTPVRWLKDGSLVVKIETTMDGNNNYATAIRTVVLGFGRSGPAKVLKSRQEVSSHIEPDN